MQFKLRTLVIVLLSLNVSELSVASFDLRKNNLRRFKPKLFQYFEVSIDLTIFAFSELYVLHNVGFKYVRIKFTP